MDKKKRIEELVEKLNRYSYEYYSLDKPSVTDKQYDAEYYELVDLEKEIAKIPALKETIIEMGKSLWQR